MARSWVPCRKALQLHCLHSFFQVISPSYLLKNSLAGMACNLPRRVAHPPT